MKKLATQLLDFIKETLETEDILEHTITENTLNVVVECHDYIEDILYVFNNDGTIDEFDGGFLITKHKNLVSVTNTYKLICD